MGNPSLKPQLLDGFSAASRTRALPDCVQHPFEMDLDVRLLHGVSAEIPAGRVASVREEAVHAGLRRGRIEDQFALAIFVENGVVMLDGHAAKGLSVGGDAIAKDGIVGGVGECEKKDCTYEGAQHDAPQPGSSWADSVTGFGHGLNYTWRSVDGRSIVVRTASSVGTVLLTTND